MGVKEKFDLEANIITDGQWEETFKARHKVTMFSCPFILIVVQVILSVFGQCYVLLMLWCHKKFILKRRENYFMTKVC